MVQNHSDFRAEEIKALSELSIVPLALWFRQVL